MANLQDLYNAILNGKLEQAVAVTQEAINEGISPTEIINQYMVKAMEEIGARFEAGKAFVPNLLLAARAMKGSLELLKPLMRDKNTATIGKVVIGTVKGDLHDIGKNLVRIMMETGGFDVYDLGRDVALDTFVEYVRNNDVDILCMSSLMTTTMPGMEAVINRLKEEGLRDKVKIMVGGAPVSPAFAEKIGADGYTRNAIEAVAFARKLVGAA